MDWYEDILDCAYRKNEIWLRRTNEIIVELSSYFDTKSHKAIVLWGLSMANEVHNKLSHYVFVDPRSKNVIDKATDWAFGRDNEECKEGYT